MYGRRGVDHVQGRSASPCTAQTLPILLYPVPKVPSSSGPIILKSTWRRRSRYGSRVFVAIAADVCYGSSTDAQAAEANAMACSDLKRGMNDVDTLGLQHGYEPLIIAGRHSRIRFRRYA